MAIPRLQHAFGVIGDLRMGCLVIFVTVLLISTYFTNKYIGMNITSRVLRLNPRNFSRDLIEKINKTHVSTSEKGSFAIGSVGSIYFVLSIYGLIGIIAREIYLLIAPIVLLPTTAFIMFVLIFFDLGIQESSGFAYFWVFTGFVIKIIMIAASIYCFLVVFSYYLNVTTGPQVELPTPSIIPGPGFSLKLLNPFKAFSDAAKTPNQTTQTKNPTSSPYRAEKSPPKTPPPRPPPPKNESP